MIAEVIVWEATLGEALVAIGTGGLAFFTWRLARKTADEVDVAQKSIELNQESIRLSRESIEALDRPFIIAVPRDETALGLIDNQDSMNLRMNLWNIGKGPGIVQELRLAGPDGRELTIEGSRVEIPIAAGMDRQWGLGLHAAWNPRDGARLTLQIHYRSAAGIRYVTISQARVTGREQYVECMNYSRVEADRVSGRPAGS